MAVAAPAPGQDGDQMIELIRRIKAQTDGAAGGQAAADPPRPAPLAPTDDPQSELFDQMRSLIDTPSDRVTPDQVDQQLSELTSNATQLALAVDDDALRLRALSVQMQSMYARIVARPQGPDVDRLLSRLRAAARRAKTLDVPNNAAPAEGDFWLMTAELIDVNRIGLSVAARQKQAAQLMGDFLKKHGKSIMAPDVRATYRMLQQARGVDVDAAADPIEALRGAIQQRMPNHWQVAAIDATTLSMHRADLTEDHLIAGRGGQATLWLIDARQALAPDSEVAKATELNPWRGKRVFLSGGAEDWPTMRQDVEASLKATQGAAIEPTNR